MKILTLNTHSLLEENYEKKLKQFVALVEKELPAVFALQEVNQTKSAKEVECPRGYISCSMQGKDRTAGCICNVEDLGQEQKRSIIIREDNAAYRLSELLRADSLEYSWTWIRVKMAYGKYEEGLAFFTRTCILQSVEFCISRIDDCSNWKTRKALGIKTGIVPAWYFNVHMGWWEDEEEPFRHQWDAFCDSLKKVVKPQERCYILGDFNSPSNRKQEGYDYVAASGWKDTWKLAAKKDSGITVDKMIDGWDESAERVNTEEGMRIDYIWCNEIAAIKYSKVICNGREYPVISDHYGVMVEIDEVKEYGLLE